MARSTLKIRFSMITAACLTLIATVGGNPPNWWSEGNPPVITPSALKNNHGPSNIGQAKWMAKSALEALRDLNPSIAASVENALVGPNRPIPSWNPPANEEERTNQHAPLLIGQLKAIATPFYDALHAVEPEWLETQLTGNLTKDTQDASNFYPWTASNSDDQNKAPATIGQLKAVFSLRFEGLRDSDGDGISDWKEIVMETDPQDPDTDEDGLTDSEEIEIGTDPKDSDSDDDGLSDGSDADPNEILVDWEKSSEAAYILIDIEGPPGEIARDLNDKGEVLFDSGIWSEGEFVALPMPGTMFGSYSNGTETQEYEVDPIGYLAFSSSYQMMGWSHVTFTSGQASGGDGIDTAWASNPAQSTLHLADDIPFNAGVLSLHPLGIDDTGRAFSRNSYRVDDPPPSTEWHEKRRVLVSALAGNSAPIFLEPSSGFFVDGLSWQFHSDLSSSGYFVTNTSSDIEGSPNTTYRLAMWDNSLNELTLPASSEGWFYPVHVNDLPNGKPALAATKAGSGGDCVFLKNPSGQMEKCESLSGKKVRIFAGDGTAMTSDHHLWRNGKLIPMRDLCDRFGDLIDDGWNLQPFKSNKQGVYLIQAVGPEGEHGNKIAVRVALDVNGDGDILDSCDSFTAYMPGYENAKATIHSGASFNIVQYHKSQKMNLCIQGLGSGSVDSAIFKILNPTNYAGYCGNALAKDGTPKYQEINSGADFSFDAVEEDFEINGTIEANRILAPIYCKDYGAWCEVEIILKKNGKPFGPPVRLTLPLDQNGDKIADIWQDKQNAAWNDQFKPAAPRPITPASRSLVSPDLDDEEIDPDGNSNGDGGRNLPAMKVEGDGLKILEEYRGYILDGGPEITAGQHKRLSSARKELLVECSVEQDLTSANKNGEGTNQGALAGFMVPDAMEDVSNFYRDAEKGASIDLYWVEDEMEQPGQRVSYAPHPFLGRGAWEWYGEVRYTGPTEAGGNISIPLPWAAGVPLTDYLWRTINPDAHDGFYKSGLRHLQSVNRSPVLEDFVKLLLPTRTGYLKGGLGQDENGQTIVDPDVPQYFSDGAAGEHSNGAADGAYVCIAAQADEGIGYYRLEMERHFTGREFDGLSRRVIAHEIGHLIHHNHSGVSNEDTIMDNTNMVLPDGTVRSLSASQWHPVEIGEINLPSRKSVNTTP